MNISGAVPDAVKDRIPRRIRMRARQELNKLSRDAEVPTLICVMDSCRYDVFTDIEDGWIEEEKTLVKAYSDASWTIPAHEAFVRGHIPSNGGLDPLDVFENDYPRIANPLPLHHDFAFSFTAITYLSESRHISYPFGQYFDEYKCLEDHRSRKEIERKTLSTMEGHDSFFGLLNFGETHGPWSLPPDEAETLQERAKTEEGAQREVKSLMKEGAAEIIQTIKVIEKNAPAGTQIILTADHGEIIGENGKFGHAMNAGFHRKLFEVPLLYWTVS